jgi:23S rRNA pseudouridine1911/1915/1917 synthase
VLAHRQVRTSDPGIVTRLDKQTSGIVLVAVGPDVHRIVQLDAEAGLVKKEYLALVSGTPYPRRGVIDQALGRDTRDRRRVAATEGGMAATTRYEVIAAQADRSLVRCELVTGRTHQIRLHLASRGWPIIGDAVYGTRDEQLGDRHALHAWRVSFPHPSTRQALVLVAPPPVELVDAAPALFAAAGVWDPACVQSSLL